MDALNDFRASIIAAILAFILAVATMLGLVSSRVAAGNESIGSVSQKVGDYGTNAKF